MYCPAELVDWCQCCRQGVRVSGGHLYEVEAPTEAAAETSLSYPHSPSNLFGDNYTTKVVYTAYKKISLILNFIPQQTVCCFLLHTVQRSFPQVRVW